MEAHSIIQNQLHQKDIISTYFGTIYNLQTYSIVYWFEYMTVSMIPYTVFLINLLTFFLLFILYNFLSTLPTPLSSWRLWCCVIFLFFNAFHVFVLVLLLLYCVGYMVGWFFLCYYICFGWLVVWSVLFMFLFLYYYICFGWFVGQIHVSGGSSKQVPTYFYHWLTTILLLHINILSLKFVKIWLHPKSNHRCKWETDMEKVGASCSVLTVAIMFPNIATEWTKTVLFRSRFYRTFITMQNCFLKAAFISKKFPKSGGQY